ncbi:MAG TPA: SCO family protein [Gammaproteobacteria bacterium]|nr:SCO family protein [Gammaproteobacteria bacterium]
MRYPSKSLVLLAGFFCAAFFQTAGAEPAPAGGNAQLDAIKDFQYKEALQRSQDAIGNLLGDYALTDEKGHALSLSDLRGKPLVLSMIYTSCYQICPMTTRHLAKVVDKARDALGHDSFNVAILGFDAYNDSPQAMIQFARKQSIDSRGWHLLSASPDTINALSKELGFEFFASPNGFDHITQATVIDAEGRVYRQVYGEVFDTPLLVEPLKDLVLGQPRPNQTLLSELINKVRFFCTTYDPARDAYHFDYSLFIGMAIGASIILIGIVLLIREVRHGRRAAGT